MIDVFINKDRLVGPYHIVVHQKKGPRLSRSNVHLGQSSTMRRGPEPSGRSIKPEAVKIVACRTKRDPR